MSVARYNLNDEHYESFETRASSSETVVKIISIDTLFSKWQGENDHY